MSVTVDDALFSVTATHSGNRRSRNEDAVLARDRRGLWAVADGMGGHVEGHRASHAVIDALDKTIEAAPQRPPEAVTAVLEQVNAQLHARGDTAVTGSTAVVLALTGAEYACYWVGDSRAYLFRNGSLQCLSRDHREAPEGAGSPLTQAVGAQPSVAIEQRQGALYQDDIFLLCSDGLTGVVDEVTIATILDRVAPTEIGDSLVAEALAAGGPDNISIVAVFVRGGSH